MRYFILIKYITAAAEHSVACIDKAVCTKDDAQAAEQPGGGGICSVCRTEALCANTATGDVWNDASAYFESGACSFCGCNTIHLGCALSTFSQVNCYSCGRAVCGRFAELNELIEHLRRDDTEPANAETSLHALNSLESMGRCLAALTLHSYDMTVDELASLKKIIEKIGASHPNAMCMATCIIRIKSISRAQTSESFACLTDVQTLAVGLPIFGTMITPHFIAEVREE